MIARLATGAAFSLAALIALCVFWELFGAPLRPGGSWLVLKAFPLFLPLRGILHRRRYTYQWSSLLALAYVAEGLVRGTSDPGLSRTFAQIELVLATSFFGCCVAYARLTRAPARRGPANPPPA